MLSTLGRAFIFGSFAEDAQSADSDVDVLVEVNAPMGLKFIAMIQDIEKAAGTTADVITAKQAHELERKFSYDILSKARLVYDRASEKSPSPHTLG